MDNTEDKKKYLAAYMLDNRGNLKTVITVLYDDDIDLDAQHAELRSVVVSEKKEDIDTAYAMVMESETLPGYGGKYRIHRYIGE